MAKMHPSLVIIPTYNEADNIDFVLGAITSLKLPIDILVVDDNSPDGTRNHVLEFQESHPEIHLLDREKKEGLAAAYIAGFQWGLNQHYKYLIQMDADLSHDPKDLSRFLKALDTYDLVIGSRYIKGGATVGWSRFRKCVSRGGNLYARSVLALPYLELTGGFNGWRASALEKVDFSNLSAKGYAFQIELKYRAHKQGLKLLEIPISFREPNAGRSKMSGNIILEAARKVFEIRSQQNTNG